MEALRRLWRETFRLRSANQEPDERIVEKIALDPSCGTAGAVAGVRKFDSAGGKFRCGQLCPPHLEYNRGHRLDERVASGKHVVADAAPQRADIRAFAFGRNCLTAGLRR
jgi:hypothetical protein